MLLESLSDPMLLVLLAAATVSFIIGIIQDPQNGWIEGAAIFLAVALVAFITSSNDYSKELQFRALERSSLQDDKSSVIRSGVVQLIKTSELVVGDIVKLQAGDMVPADCILISRATASCNESALTGEPEDVQKSTLSDPFLLSSCLITESEGDLRALVIGIGMNSQWGKIKSTLVSEPKNTPLQDKLEDITTQVNKIDFM
jgi:P-type E1-E2 ATPase